MKKWIILFSVTAIMSACKESDKNATNGPGNNDNSLILTEEQKKQALTDTSNFTSLEWIDPMTQNLGKLIKDQTIEISFRFRNTGSKNLVIENVSAQCGCTIPEKPEKPIAPGEEGLIKASFNGAGHGAISKQIYVKANTSPLTDHTLTFTGEIQEK
jgi:hypothetical protein